ncbi:hypothetical protein BP5796_12768 [Coleophoma crateriformis]|uniref:Transcription factor domain-containing protein n=1 Tax=Coleophoma crateriformis TaxID=565419 RepID=A0A3D8Q6P6_9HELO|nr:hypothetical protein BP5796_12768 [Coleophoma crateriformis]
MSRLPCLRYRVTTSISLYREQEAPNAIWTRRWRDFKIRNITEWASADTRKIKITQGMGTSSYELEVREFIPIEGDLMEKFWSAGGVRKAYRVTPYAIVNLEKAARSRLQFVNDHVGTYIAYGVSNSDLLVRMTYERAMQHAKEAKSEEEKILLRNTLYLWVAARMSSTTEWLCGDDKLDMMPVNDITSPYFDHTPIPPVMSAQFQIIAFSRILRPLKKSVLKHLSNMGSAADTRKNWFTLYLTYFLLLHNCSLVTRRNEEYARQLDLPTQFANPQSISDYHQGALVLLADFHYSNKGQLPFSMAENSKKLEELADIAELNLDQVLFIKNTATLVQQQRGQMMQAREGRVFTDDYYFISQLYDKDWVPSPIA